MFWPKENGSITPFPYQNDFKTQLRLCFNNKRLTLKKYICIHLHILWQIWVYVPNHVNVSIAGGSAEFPVVLFVYPGHW